MPFVNVKLVDGVLTREQRHQMAAGMTDVRVALEGSGAFREVVWVPIDELHTDVRHIGGEPFRGPESLMEHLSRSTSMYEPIDGHPVTPPTLAAGAVPEHPPLAVAERSA